MDGRKIISTNRKARHNYEIEETYDAGIALTGTEIKSVRAGRVNLQDSYAIIQRREAWVMNLHIGPYEFGHGFNVEPRRTRKLLLHRGEINRLMGKTQQKGLALIPLSIYLERGRAKLEIGLGRGKKLYDKRQAIADREARRDQERALSGRG